jgi:hypothetical protein
MAEMGFAIGKAKASVPWEGCGFIPNPKLKLLDQVSEVMRFKHYSIRTETTYRIGSSVSFFSMGSGTRARWGRLKWSVF